MSRKEQKRLIRQKGYGNEYEEEDTELSKKRIFLCCCFCLLILLMLCLSVFLFKMIYTRNSKPLRSPNEKLDTDFKLLDLSKIGYPKNVSEFLTENRKLCDKVTNKEKTETAENLNHIYVIKGDNNITEIQACGIESILRLFPDKTIFLIDFNKKTQVSYDRCNTPQNYLGLLLYLYKDRLEHVHANSQTFFKDTPLQNVTKKEKNLEFFAILLTAYRYGGFVATPDLAMARRDFLECFPEETIVEPFAIFAAQKCDNFLHYLMQSFIVCDLPEDHALDTILIQSVDVYSRSHSSKLHLARRLKSYEICEEVEGQDPCPLLKLKRFGEGDLKWIAELSSYCKQVVQAFLGIEINKMEVKEETSKIKSSIDNDKKTCGYGYKLCDT